LRTRQNLSKKLNFSATRASGTKLPELLALVYGWFTEGFETLDLKEAKGLLDELTA
jgi:hypothetical protein